MKPQENKVSDQANPDDIVAPLTIDQIQNDAVSIEDEAELAQIWQHEPKLHGTVESNRESGSVTSTTERP